jgi:hypothetical protein
MFFRNVIALMLIFTMLSSSKSNHSSKGNESVINLTGSVYNNVNVSEEGGMEIKLSEYEVIVYKNGYPSDTLFFYNDFKVEVESGNSYSLIFVKPGYIKKSVDIDVRKCFYNTDYIFDVSLEEGDLYGIRHGGKIRFDRKCDCIVY